MVFWNATRLSKSSAVSNWLRGVERGIWENIRYFSHTQTRMISDGTQMRLSWVRALRSFLNTGLCFVSCDWFSQNLDKRNENWGHKYWKLELHINFCKVILTKNIPFFRMRKILSSVQSSWANFLTQSKIWRWIIRKIMIFELPNKFFISYAYVYVIQEISRLSFTAKVYRDTSRSQSQIIAKSTQVIIQH